MKYLLILLLTLSANVFARPSCEDNPNNPNCSGDYPGYAPTWDERYAISCEMATVDGEERASFKESGIDYAQAGSLFVAINGAVISWYQQLADTASATGIDARLIPDLNPLVTEMIRIEKVMSGKLDE